MRTTMVMVMREMTRVDSFASAAAMVAISAPHNEKTTVVTPASTATQPNGTKPPREYRLANVGPASDVKPNAYAPAIRMNATIAATLIEENQNSNSPYERADIKFTAVSSTMRMATSCHTSSGIQA